MRGGEGFILVYSITDRSSFIEMKRFKDTIDRVRNYETVPLILVANKKDLERRRQVTTKEGEEMAKTFGCQYFESSAALRHNVDELYYTIVRCIRNKELAESGQTKISSSNGGLRSFCCFSSPTKT